jgi:hypothetical protein
MKTSMKPISDYMILIGIVITISSLVFIYYHVNFVLGADIWSSKTSMVHSVELYCLDQKFYNSSVNLTECTNFDDMNRFFDLVFANQGGSKEYTPMIGLRYGFEMTKYYLPVLLGLCLTFVGWLLRGKYIK